MHNKKFIWDENKHIINKRKHGVSFEEAGSVFDDETHSHDEDRFIIIGMSRFDRLLLVCHCYRENDAVIRIISARKATKTEAEQYRGV